MTQAVAKNENKPQAVVEQHPAHDGGAMIAMIERVALNPAVDIDKMERLLEMQERIMARNAKMAYASDFALMQAELPVIEERGNITVHKKDAPKTAANVIQSTPYALWEDINDGIKPVLSKYGFALTFRTGQTTEGRITVTAILMHREGHTEETTMILQHDSTGSKNAVQAIGSSTSYGKRYAAAALLNLTSRDGAERDDDGKAAVAAMPKSEARPVDAEMRDEINACSTVSQLEILWKSKQFKAEYERLPLDWQKSMLEHFKERKADIERDAPAFVPPNFDKMER